jgi:hypothetical protein
MNISAKPGIFGWNLWNAGFPYRFLLLCKDAGWLGFIVLVCLITFVISSFALKTDHSDFS